MMFCKNLILIVLTLSVANLYAADVLKLVDQTSISLKRKGLEKIYGPLKKDKSIELSKKSKDFELTYNSADKFLSLTPVRPISFDKLNYDEFTLGPMVRERDMILGQLVSVPRLGLYMQVNPAKEIVSFQWKEPWMVKKTLTKKEAMSKLMNGEVRAK